MFIIIITIASIENNIVLCLFVCLVVWLLTHISIAIACIRFKFCMWSRKPVGGYLTDFIQFIWEWGHNFKWHLSLVDLYIQSWNVVLDLASSLQWFVDLDIFLNSSDTVWISGAIIWE